LIPVTNIIIETIGNIFNRREKNNKENQFIDKCSTFDLYQKHKNNHQKLIPEKYSNHFTGNPYLHLSTMKQMSTLLPATMSSLYILNQVQRDHAVRHCSIRK
jgi:hypothetical protein